MRVKLDEGIATGGGTTKFRDVFLKPGHTAPAAVPQERDRRGRAQPWTDQPAGDRHRARRRRRQPGRPAPAVALADTQVDLDLFDVAHNVVGPLTYTFSFYEIMPQLPRRARTTASSRRSRAGRSTPPTRRPRRPSRRTRCGSPPSTSRTTSRWARSTTATHHPGRVRRQDRHRSSRRSTTSSSDPDVVAVQEVAVFANGHNALTGLAAALGNYTPYNAVNNDARGIAPGFLIKNGVTASNPRLLGKAEHVQRPQRGHVRPRGRPAVRPRAVRAGHHARATSTSPRSATTGPRSRTRRRAASPRRSTSASRRSALQAAGRNVLVAGDLNDFESSPSLARLTQGGTLTDLWSKAPAGQRLLVQVRRPPADARPHPASPPGLARAWRTCATSTSTTTTTSVPTHGRDGTGDLRPRPAADHADARRREHEHERRRHRHGAGDAGADARRPGELGAFVPGSRPTTPARCRRRSPRRPATPS